MDALFEVGSRSLSVRPVYRAGGFDLEIDGRRTSAELLSLGGGEYELRIDGAAERIFLARDGDRAFVHLRGRSVEVDAVDLLERVRRTTRALHGAGELRAPMPGVVIELRVALGDVVQPSDTLLVIESMKLQTSIQADTSGRVTELPVAIGQSFRRGDVLARLEPIAEREEAS